jgi:hypothetical protein
MVYYPFAFAAAVLVSLVAFRQSMGRLAGAALLVIYGAFVALVILDPLKID